MNKFLQRLKSRKNDIKVAIIGLGAMGKGLYYQCTITPGVKCIAASDLDVNKCIQAAKLFNDPYKVVRNHNELSDAANHNRIAVCDDGMLLSRCEEADVVIEASNAIGEGAKFVISALEHKKHVVLMNAEIDLLYGVYFMQVAKENNVICTSIDGDQYGVIKRLIDDFELWGFQPVMAGNIKGFLDRYANPTGIIPEADKRNLDYRMCTSYTDGTKLCIEMAIIANSFGMRTLQTGMIGPPAKHVTEVFSLFDLEKIWQEDDTPFVDYILGAEPGGGVFAVGYSDNPYQKKMMEYYKMGDGPFYLFYRPYHLCHVEALRSSIAPFLDNEALLQPHMGFQTNVFTFAKKDLKAGEELDGLGGYTCYGQIENCDGTNEKTALPILLADEVKLKRDIQKDEEITLDDIIYDPDAYAFDLYFKTVKVSDYVKKNNLRAAQKFSFPKLPNLELKFWK